MKGFPLPPHDGMHATGSGFTSMTLADSDGSSGNGVVATDDR